MTYFKGNFCYFYDKLLQAKPNLQVQCKESSHPSLNCHAMHEMSVCVYNNRL